MPGELLIIGCGNSLRGDDGVGMEVVRALWAQREGIPDLRHAGFMWSQQLLPELALDLSRSSLAVFVDAASDGGRPGSVAVQVLRPSGPGQARGPSALPSGCWQELGPTDLLALSAGLYGTAPLALLVTVSIASTDFGLRLSPLVEASVPVAATAVRLAITAWYPHREAPGAQPEPGLAPAEGLCHA